MLPFKVTVDLTKILPPQTPNPPVSPAGEQPADPLPIVAPTPIQSVPRPVSPIGDGLRGYYRQPVTIHPRDMVALRFPRLTKAINAGVNLFLSPTAEKQFAALSIPYICLGTAENTEQQSAWSELMSQPAVTFHGGLE